MFDWVLSKPLFYNKKISELDLGKDRYKTHLKPISMSFVKLTSSKNIVNQPTSEFIITLSKGKTQNVIERSNMYFFHKQTPS